MLSFRKWMPAFAGLALFTGIASAQTATSQLQCSTVISQTPPMRGEGFAELTGDIALNCTGGNVLPAGAEVPRVNIQIFMNTGITSRLIGTGAAAASEALLLIDDPGSAGPVPVAGFGSGAAQTVCATPLTGCAAYAGFQGNVPVAVGGLTGTAPDYSKTAPNVFRGIVSGNSVTFFGVPVLPPGTSSQRGFRITNLRVNATTLNGGSSTGQTPVIASISVSGQTAFLISNPTPTVGSVQAGLIASVGTAATLTQCSSQTKTSLALLTFKEGFGTAFKTRVQAASDLDYAGQTNAPTQNIPNTIYNSESGLVLGIPGQDVKAGLADFGTRLKASFTAVPKGVRLFVSTSNVKNLTAAYAVADFTGGTKIGGLSTTSYAQLVTSETIPDGAAQTTGFFPAVPVDPNSTAPGSTGSVNVVEIPVATDGTATAVWEVVNTNPNMQESIIFAVYASYTSNVAQNSPATGTGLVNLSFAPTFTGTTPAVASSSLPIPRFAAPDANAAKSLFTISVCRSVLLYPFVTNIAGFDTGLAISNTSTDPLGTGAQAGTCDLNWYQGTTNPAKTTTASIASGTVYTTLASSAAPGFSGYMIAVCNFQLAHGFAFISDIGARNLAMGYLALVIPDGARGGYETLGN